MSGPCNEASLRVAASLRTRHNPQGTCCGSGDVQMAIRLESGQAAIVDTALLREVLEHGLDSDGGLAVRAAAEAIEARLRTAIAGVPR